MKRIFSIIAFLFACMLHSQTPAADSLYEILPELEINASREEDLLRSPYSENIISNSMISQQHGQSLLPAVNTAPGVRMEERSPGSYRLSIRGSLLRSPFGVRNVKIYIDDFPFTDAGGNTYLNSIDPLTLHSIHILKGPEGSTYGANTGGAVMIDPVEKLIDSLPVIAELRHGSFNSSHQKATLQATGKKNLLSLSFASQNSDGYRQQSAMRRGYLHAYDRWNYSSANHIKLFFLYSDLHYETPGGLTSAQFDATPFLARPSTATLPGAVAQKAGVDNRTLFGGISHGISATRFLDHVISVFGSQTEFKNPFITNYEERNERTGGFRSHFDVHSYLAEKLLVRGIVGTEWQQTQSEISNFGNRSGEKDTLQAKDKVFATQGFFFAKIVSDWNKKIIAELSASFNTFGYRYRNDFPQAQAHYTEKRPDPQLMPRAGLSYMAGDNWAIRASVSRGYSPPTLAEIRPSDNNFYFGLQAESGWNYETGFRWYAWQKRLWLDISAFYFALENAIVRRLNDNGAEYFVNAGGTQQPGAEGKLNLLLLPQRKYGLFRTLQMNSSATWNNFRFSNYVVNGMDCSGKKLTGVPEWMLSENLSAEFPYGLSAFLNYYYSSSIPLNDINSDFAEDYHLVQFKVSWSRKLEASEFSVFFGIDNLLNEKYSLGNDLNAPGKRYFNPAPPINYYGGLNMKF